MHQQLVNTMRFSCGLSLHAVTVTLEFAFCLTYPIIMCTTFVADYHLVLCHAANEPYLDSGLKFYVNYINLNTFLLTASVNKKPGLV